MGWEEGWDAQSFSFFGQRPVDQEHYIKWLTPYNQIIEVLACDLT